MNNTNSSVNTPWYPYSQKRTLGQRGSEYGIIVQEEQHVEGARITLERDCPTAPLAITCGIGGWLVHTRYFSTEAEAQQAYEEMK